MDLEFIDNLKQSLFKKESVASLGLFRMMLGLVLFVQTLWFIKTDFLVENVFEPTLHFKFYYFQFRLDKLLHSKQHKIFHKEYS